MSATKFTGAIGVLERQAETHKNNIPIAESEGRTEDAQRGRDELASIEAAISALKIKTHHVETYHRDTAQALCACAAEPDKVAPGDLLFPVSWLAEHGVTPDQAINCLSYHFPKLTPSQAQ